MSEIYENLSPGGHLAFAEEIFIKLKTYLDTKGDTKVTQTGSVLTNADYEILLSKSANDTTETDTVNKASGLTYNPSTNQLKINGTAVLTQHQDISGKANTSDAIKEITRNGTTFTATRADDTTFTFTQQDTNTTYSAGTGIEISGNNNSINVKLKNGASHTTLVSADVSQTTGRQYAVNLDANNVLSVNVPWTNTNTTYSFASGTSNGTIHVTPSTGNAYDVTVKGLGSRAFDSTSYLPLTGGTCSGNITVSKSSGESDIKVVSGSANCYIFANSSNISGVYTNKGYLINYEANNLLQVGRTDGGMYLRNGEVSVGNGAFNAYKAVKASAFNVQSSKLVKENIKPITDDEARKLLDVDVVTFDYKENFGGDKGLFGVIAEDTVDIIPSVVSVPDGYDEKNFDESKGINQPIMSVDYAKFVPHLIKMVQIQEQRIKELESTIK